MDEGKPQIVLHPLQRHGKLFLALTWKTDDHISGNAHSGQGLRISFIRFMNQAVS